MNENLKYKDLIKAQSLAQEITWQDEDEAYQALAKYIHRAHDFAKNYVMNREQLKMIADLQNAINNSKTALVRVYGIWYEVWTIFLDEKVVVLDKHSSDDDRVFIWEVGDCVVKPETQKEQK